MTDKERAYALLGILQSYAPNSEAQALCASIYNAECTYSERVVRMLCNIYDGLTYGNWPWVKFHLNVGV